MSLRNFLMLFTAFAGSGAAATASPQPGAQKFFKDWAVACDNTLSCEAIALQADGYPDEGLSLAVARASSDGKVTVRLYGADTQSDRYRILVDGRFVDSGALVAKGSSAIEVSGTDAIKLTRAIARGKVLRLEDGAGSELGRASLAGSAAALRHIDAMQNQAGTKSALAAAGKRKSTPKSLPLPLITVKRIVPIDAVPDASSIVRLVESSGCIESRNGVTEDIAHSLGRTDGVAQALVLVSCGMGAYQGSHVPYVGKQGGDGQWQFAPARFDFRQGPSSDKGPTYLINADWDASKQQLSSFAKGRGFGDCGSSESYVWDGSLFRLVEAFGMEQCRGSMDWMTLWRAEVKLVD